MASLGYMHVMIGVEHNSSNTRVILLEHREQLELQDHQGNLLAPCYSRGQDQSFVSVHLATA